VGAKCADTGSASVRIETGAAGLLHQRAQRTISVAAAVFVPFG
jgi:hypothetical protein